jgi:hypothetical protein
MVIKIPPHHPQIVNPAIESLRKRQIKNMLCHPAAFAWRAHAAWR